MRNLSSEQLLAIADECAHIYKVRIRSFAALCACAAVPGAHLHGVPVYDTAHAAACGLADTIRSLRPLTGANDAFADVAGTTYLRWVEEA